MKNVDRIYKNTIKITYSCDDNYTLPLLCSIQSIIHNSDKNNLYEIYILHDKERLCNKNKNYIKKMTKQNVRINFIQIDFSIFKDFPISKQCDHISKETYFRFLLPEIFHDVQKILYIDCDTIVLSNLLELYLTDIFDFYIAGVEDAYSFEFCERLNIKKYINAGVLLFNLEKIRKENLQAKLFKYAVDHRDAIPLQDQDVLNAVLQNGIKMLDKKWNTQVIDRENKIDNAAIIHYICKLKPWNVQYNSWAKSFFFKYFNHLNFIIKFEKYYFPNRNYFMKNLRKKIISYYKTDKILIIFNYFKIHF